MDETVATLRERPYYNGQIVEHRTVPRNEAHARSFDGSDRLASVLADSGITELYEHQSSAIGAVRDGRNVVLATPTASGKSFAYTVPAFERAMDHM